MSMVSLGRGSVPAQREDLEIGFNVNMIQPCPSGLCPQLAGTVLEGSKMVSGTST